VIKARLGIYAKSEPPSPPTRSAAKPKPSDRPDIIGTDGLIGLLTIPRLHLRAIVREGAGDGVLSLGVGHIPGTALPGQNGNIGLAGHRDTLFRGLRTIVKDDLILLGTLRGVYAYRVESTQIVRPSNVSVLYPGPHAELTLVTCYPFYYVGAAPDRFIVKTRQVSWESSQGEPKPEIAESAEEPVIRPIATQAHGVTDQARPVQEERHCQLRTARGVAFQVSEGHSRTLVPGISFGLTSADASGHRVYGWMWIMPERRTIRLKNQDARKPVIFYPGHDGKRRELVITRVSRNSVTGCLLLPSQR
jgi:sortase A